MANKTTITSVQFRNFKALKEFSVSLQQLNILVGPNNSGKSTILSAFRMLEQAMRTARAKRPSRVRDARGFAVAGHQLVETTIPISLDNIHTDLADEASWIEFRFSNQNHLILLFPEDGGCRLYWNVWGRKITSTVDFKEAFPFYVQVIPVLGPVEQDEVIVADETVKRSSGTPNASRHFRNYWHKYPEGFDEFRKLVEETWPGMSIAEPELASYLERRLVMFCSEDRMFRELYWSGLGFQVWCQLLTHISRCDNSDLLVIDEPEVYLHPDVQRQLIGILRSVNPDIVMATHSTEMLGEADPSEIMVIDKAQKSGRRLRDLTEVQTALETIGSAQNITLTQLARTRKMLFTEGSMDYKLLRRFALVLGYRELAAGHGLANFESGGLGFWERVRALAWGFRKSFSTPIRVAAIYDRDYLPDSKILEMLDDMRAELDFAHVHHRKEIENYLLVPDALDRCVDRLIRDKERRGGSEIEKDEDVKKILSDFTDRYKIDCQSKWQSKYLEHTQRDGRDGSELHADFLEDFESRWAELDDRMTLVPGKRVLADLRRHIQDKWGITLTDIRIIESFKKDEVPEDLVELIKGIDRFRAMSS